MAYTAQVSKQVAMAVRKRWPRKYKTTTRRSAPSLLYVNPFARGAKFIKIRNVVDLISN